MQPKGYATSTQAADVFFSAIVRKDVETAVNASNDSCGMHKQARLDEFQEGMVSDPIQSYQVLSVSKRSSKIDEIRVQLIFVSGEQVEFPYQVVRGSDGWRLQFDRFYRDKFGNVSILPCESQDLTFVDKLMNMIRSLF
jgi:hypothetical protein